MGKAETQVVAGTNFRLVLKIRRKTGPSCSDDLEQICTGVMYHRPIGCSESDYSSCLQLIREDDITCAQSSMVKVAPLSSANEDVYGRPRHAEEAGRGAAVLREVDPCHEEKKVGPCKAAIPRFFFDGASGSCSSFTYGGCRGNGNNFASQQECEAKCIISRRIALDVVTRGTNATEWSPLPHNPWVEESLEVTEGRLSPLRARRLLLMQ